MNDRCTEIATCHARVSTALMRVDRAEPVQIHLRCSFVTDHLHVHQQLVHFHGINCNCRCGGQKNHFCATMEIPPASGCDNLSRGQNKLLHCWNSSAKVWSIESVNPKVKAPSTAAHTTWIASHSSSPLPCSCAPAPFRCEIPALLGSLSVISRSASSRTTLCISLVTPPSPAFSLTLSHSRYHSQCFTHSSVSVTGHSAALHSSIRCTGCIALHCTHQYPAVQC